jgi:spore maturation protein CgeB
MNPRLLIIGNTSEIYHIGSIFVRAAEALDISVVTYDTDWSISFPSMQHLWGRAFYKLAGNRALEWWTSNRKIASLIREVKPTLILVTGTTPIAKDVFEAVAQVGARIANYLTDYPWNPRNHCPCFLENLNQYDFIFSTKSSILQELKDFNVKRVEFLPFGYDSLIHRVPKLLSEHEREKFYSDITFIGTADQERLPYLNALAEIKGISLNVYGGLWNKINIPGWKVHPAIFNRDLQVGTYCSNLVLGIIRKCSKDQSTMRTFEIAACGGCGIYEDTEEHRKILAGYPDYGFFTSPHDLAEKCQWLLEHSEEREQMRQLGMRLIVTESNTYTARLKQILERTSYQVKNYSDSYSDEV